jgi:hypothetical protein
VTTARILMAISPTLRLVAMLPVLLITAISACAGRGERPLGGNVAVVAVSQEDRARMFTPPPGPVPNDVRMAKSGVRWETP